MLYSLCYTGSNGIIIRLDSLEDRYQIAQILVDGCDFMWCIFNRLPESVELDTRFSKLNSDGNNS
jgi:hypothetical protein